MRKISLFSCVFKKYINIFFSEPHMTNEHAISIMGGGGKSHFNSISCDFCDFTSFRMTTCFRK